MKKILSIFGVFILLFLSSCYDPNSEPVVFDGEVVVEGIGNVEGVNSDFEGEGILTLSTLEKDGENNNYIFITKDLWEEYNISQTIFMTGSQIYFKGSAFFIGNDKSINYYFADEVNQLHEFIN